jgi:hypothetical protein
MYSELWADGGASGISLTADQVLHKQRVFLHHSAIFWGSYVNAVVFYIWYILFYDFGNELENDCVCIMYMLV